MRAGFLDQAELARFGQQFLLHRLRHDEDNIRVADQAGARGKSGTSV
jgi:hypothetical protein